MTWHKIDFSQKSTLPKNYGDYLCRVAMPEYGVYGFHCDNFIFTHWYNDFPELEDV